MRTFSELVGWVGKPSIRRNQSRVSAKAPAYTVRRLECQTFLTEQYAPSSYKTNRRVSGTYLENPMPSVMLKKNTEGKLVFYVPKKDLEEVAESIEFDLPDKWGGEVVLGDGSKYHFEPMNAQPAFPITLRAKRLDEGD